MQSDAVISHIVHWLNDYAQQAHAKGFVVGVSGGVDSAVVSTAMSQPVRPGTLYSTTGRPPSSATAR